MVYRVICTKLSIFRGVDGRALVQGLWDFWIVDFNRLNNDDNQPMRIAIAALFMIDIQSTEKSGNIQTKYKFITIFLS